MTRSKFKNAFFLGLAVIAVLLIRGQPRSGEGSDTGLSRSYGDSVITGFWASEANTGAPRDTQLASVSMNGGGVIYQQSENYRAGLSMAQFVVGKSGTPCPVCPDGFKVGDADGNGAWDIDDVVYLINYIFSGGPPPVPCSVTSGDADCSDEVDVDDVVYLINHIFLGGPPPCSCEEWVGWHGSPPMPDGCQCD